MIRRHRWSSLASVAMVGVVHLACSKEKPAGGNDTAPPATSPPGGLPSPGSALAAVWDTAAGPVFAIPSDDDPSHGFLIVPTYIETQRVDTLRLERTAVGDMEFDLFARGTLVGKARIAALHADTVAGCATWPGISLRDSTSEPTTQSWDVAFAAGRVSVVPFDSLPGIARTDSAHLTIAVARAASKVPGDTAAAFRGRPFVVRQANRFLLDDGRPAVVAEVVRVVNQEANPLQEQLLLVLEATPPLSGTEYGIGFAKRTIGLEESLESIELASILRLRTGAFAILLRREVGEGARHMLLERSAPNHWIERWRSAFAGC